MAKPSSAASPPTAAPFRNPDLRALVFDPAPSADGVMAFVDRLGILGK